MTMIPSAPLPAPIQRGYYSIFFISFCILFISGCHQEAPDHSAATMPKEAVPVLIATAIEKEVPVELLSIGSVEPFSSIAVKAQVSGIITKVWFNEGEEVQEGQTLFSIDARPYEVALNQAHADLAKSQAQLEVAHANLVRNQVQLENARAEFQRNSNLLSRGVVTREEFDRISTNSKSFEAAVKADEAAIKSASAAILGASAAIERARIELGYCTIRAPLTGKTGSLIIHGGNLIKANDTEALVMIYQVDPIYVAFTLPERNLPDLQQSMAEKTLEVSAAIPNTDVKAMTGTLSFLDNTVNQRTGTIRLKATFANPDRILWPGQFVTVNLVVSRIPHAVVVPPQAVQTGQAGSYVYVVKEDSTVEMHPVKTGLSRETWMVIEEGVNPGEKLITDGHVRVAPGMRVKIADDPRPDEEAVK